MDSGRSIREREFDELTPRECLDRLAWLNLGRVAVVVDDGPPLVVPVNYAIDGDVVVFRTDPGSKLAGLRTQPISFQVDFHDPSRRTGWSVLIRGVCYEVDEDHAGATPDPWAPGEKAHWVRLMPTEITGRAVVWGDGVIDVRGYL